MGKIFDSLINSNQNLAEIEKYLLERDFYNATMNPRFLNGINYDVLKLNMPCLRYDCYFKNYTLRIFINSIDIYYELESPWSSLEKSQRYNPKDYNTIEDIDNLLDEICRDCWDEFD